MSPPPLQNSDISIWASLNNVSFKNVKIANTADKGMSVSACEDLYPSEKADKSGSLLRVPRDILLSAEAVEDYAKVDQHFKQLLVTSGRQSTRGDIMLYLLCHLQLSRGVTSSKKITPTPWTEYVNFLPRNVPVPTMWSGSERALLRGTSLEIALEAKVSVLQSEFEALRESSSTLPFWNSFLWEHGETTIDDWTLVDAWYRSRCLELPRTGNTMVPGLDMVNHSHLPTTYYDEDNNDDIVLLIRPNYPVLSGKEITISYGQDKPAAEMLFSYGFIDADSCSGDITLHIDPFPDDPLAKAKLHIFGKAPVVKLSRKDQIMTWESPFAYLMCLNEEDGLDFGMLQDMEGGRHLRMFWQEDDVTDLADAFEHLIRDHPLSEVFKLRAVTVVHERVAVQLDQLHTNDSQTQLQSQNAAQSVTGECIRNSQMLREIEAGALAAALEEFQNEKDSLLKSDLVLQYLGSMEDAQCEQAQPPPSLANEEEDDFS